MQPKFFGSLPVLKHGDAALAQSLAITSYIASIAPRFASLTPLQRGVDDMYAATLEDVVAGCAKVVFGDHSTVSGLLTLKPSTPAGHCVGSCRRTAGGPVFVFDPLSSAAAVPQAPVAVAELLNKFYGAVEEMLPASGFINGEPYPTCADLACICMCEMAMPIGVAKHLAGGYSMDAFPKLLKLVGSAKDFPAVKNYLAESSTLKASPKM
eukprot:COSAG01_NODE_577_length_15268_cov_31.213462_4_plen_210_part_00